MKTEKEIKELLTNYERVLEKCEISKIKVSENTISWLIGNIDAYKDTLEYDRER